MMSVASIKDQVMIVTGAGSGVGRETALMLSRQGAKVVICDVNSEALSNTKESICARSDDRACDVLDFAADLSDESVIQQVILQVDRHYGQIDGVINCVGIWDSAPVESVSAASLERIFKINVFGMFYMCREVFPIMKRKGSGCIVNIASTAGEYGSISPAAHYAASKGAVIALSKSLAREGAPFGIRVNVISPGPLNTAMLGLTDEKQLSLISGRTLLGRVGEAGDIAHAVLYLISPASSWVTGEVLRVNGGSLL